LSILAKIVLGVTSPTLMSSERIRLDQQESDDRRDCVPTENCRCLVSTPHPETLAYSTSSSWWRRGRSAASRRRSGRSRAHWPRTGWRRSVRQLADGNGPASIGRVRRRVRHAV